MRITRDEAETIRASFIAVSRDGAAAARVFYCHLFALAPDTRDLFLIDLERQGAKLLSTLGTVAARIDDWEMLRPEIEILGLRHLAYGVRPEHYPAMGVALQAMLVESLGPAFTPEVAAAWTKVYGGIFDLMAGTGARVPDFDSPD